MTEAKIEVRVGEVFFSGGGEGKWVSEQFDKMLKHLPELTQVNSPPTRTRDHDHQAKDGVSAGRKNHETLSTFLTSKNAKSNQTRKFLAAALWLQDTGKNRMGTTEVGKALRDNNQGRLGNPSQCLNSNVGQGFCEKDGSQFYVTDEGRAEIG
jgi:hypothetical protein